MIAISGISWKSSLKLRRRGDLATLVLHGIAAATACSKVDDTKSTDVGPTLQVAKIGRREETDARWRSFGEVDGTRGGHGAH